MGLFSSIKKNLNHGGVKLQIEAPNEVNNKDASFEASVTITASTEPVKIKDLRIALHQSTSDSPMQEIRSAEHKEVIELAAGESKKITLKVPMNVGHALGDALEKDNPGLAKVANLLGTAETIGNLANFDLNRSNLVVATANIEGLALAVSQSKPILVLNPGEIGKMIN